MDIRSVGMLLTLKVVLYHIEKEASQIFVQSLAA